MKKHNPMKFRILFLAFFALLTVQAQETSKKAVKKNVFMCEAFLWTIIGLIFESAQNSRKPLHFNILYNEYVELKLTLVYCIRPVCVNHMRKHPQKFTPTNINTGIFWTKHNSPGNCAANNHGSSPRSPALAWSCWQLAHLNWWDGFFWPNLLNNF